MIPEVVRICALPAIIGVAIGSVTASFAPAPVFKIAFLFFATFIAVRMLFGGERWKLGNELPGRGMLAIYGLITGLFFLTGWSEWGRDIQRGPNAFMDGRCIRRSEHRPGSVCRSRLPVPSATCWPVGGICPFGIFLIPVALRFAAPLRITTRNPPALRANAACHRALPNFAAG